MAQRRTKIKRRRRYRLRYDRIFLLLVLAGVLCFGLVKLVQFIGSSISLAIGGEANSKITISSDPQPESSTADNSRPEEPLPTLPSDLASELHSTNAVLIDRESGQVLLEKDSQSQIYPASLTKIMTAVVVLENIEDLSEPVFLDPTLYAPLYDANAALAGFLPGDTVQAIDLLYGTMLPSGAEAATALAVHVGESVSNFVEMMNQKARELGMTHTHFTNVTGLHDDNHYSTVSDMAVLFEYALKDKTFKKIICTPEYTTQPSQSGNVITVYSTLFSRVSSTEFEGGQILGGKTGYTGDAGQCLASLGEMKGKEYILVTTGAEGNGQTEPFHIFDAASVFSHITIAK